MFEMGSGTRVVRAKRLDPPMARNTTHDLARTTYRVFDWNRAGLDGQPRELHVAQSLASIDFADIEPRLIPSKYSRNPRFAVRFLVEDPLFRIDACQVKRDQRFHLSSATMQILGLVRGRMAVTHEGSVLELQPGQFCLLPAGAGRVTVTTATQVEFLHIQTR